MTQTANPFEQDAYELVSTALGCASDSLSSSSAIYDHPDWDSFGHLQIILEIERRFEMQITDEDILRYSSMEEIVNLCKKQELRRD